MARSVDVSGEDAKQAEEGGSFKPYPAGDYIGEIIDVKDTVAAKQGDNKGKPAIDVKFKFTESGTGTGVGKKFVAFRVPVFAKWASGSSAFLFYQFFKAVGVEFPKDGESGTVDLPDNEELLAQEVGITIKIEDDNKGVPRNVVQGFFPPSKGVKDTSAEAATEVDEEFTL